MDVVNAFFDNLDTFIVIYVSMPAAIFFCYVFLKILNDTIVKLAKTPIDNLSSLFPYLITFCFGVYAGLYGLDYVYDIVGIFPSYLFVLFSFITYGIIAFLVKKITKSQSAYYELIFSYAIFIPLFVAGFLLVLEDVT